MHKTHAVYVTVLHLNRMDKVGVAGQTSSKVMGTAVLDLYTEISKLVSTVSFFSHCHIFP
jgi:hypothetical protein